VGPAEFENVVTAIRIQSMAEVAGKIKPKPQLKSVRKSKRKRKKKQ
jgi:hypothetical protein